MLFYFTATGNCLYVAKKIEENPVSIAQELKKDELVYEDQTIGIVSPVYGGELPKIVRRFIEKATFKTEYMYMVLTYGMNDSVSAQWAYYFGKTQKVHFDYIHTIKMVDNYLPVFDMLEQKAMDKKADEQIAAVLEEISERKHDIPVPSQAARERYEVASRRPAEVNNGSQITSNYDLCIGCGQCTRVCPVGNFYLKDGKAFRRTNQCEFCLACAHHCPRKAIYTSISDKNPNERYIKDGISVLEIVCANQQNNELVKRYEANFVSYLFYV